MYVIIHYIWLGTSILIFSVTNCSINISRKRQRKGRWGRWRKRTLPSGEGRMSGAPGNIWRICWIIQHLRFWDSYIFRDNQMQMQVDQDNPPGQQDVLILSQEQLNTSMLVFILFLSSPSPAGWRICGCPPSSPGKRQELPCPPCYHEIWDVRSFPSTSNMKMK